MVFPLGGFVKKLIALALFVSTSFAIAADAPYSCSAQPGRWFCGKMNQFQGLLVNCSDGGCTSLWRDQLALIRTFLDKYYDTFFPGDTSEEALGKVARKTAVTLCGYHVTGDAAWVSALVAQYNRMLKALKDLQTTAGSKAPYSCTFSET